MLRGAGRGCPFEEVSVIVCDLCGRPNACTPRQIESKEYDVCAECWAPLAEKLAGKGRPVRRTEPVIVPVVPREPERQPERVVPGKPPEIWGRSV